MSLQSTLKGAQPLIFGGNTGLTYEQMKRQRAMAALMAQRVANGSPQNAGQGLQALTGAFVSRKMGDRADAAATEGREKAQSALGALLQGRLGGGAMPGPATSFLPPQGGGYGITPGAAPGAAAFPASLIQSESGGNWGALNNEGYGGRLQFGKDRLADAARAGVIPAGVTGAEFSKLPPEVQQRVENWHFADIDQQAKRMGLDQYIGQEVAGIPITQDGIRAMAHLGGIGGAAKFLQSGGRHNPADSNGTSLADYARKHGGAPQAMALAEGQQPDLSFVSQMGGGMDPQLMAVLADPYVSELPEMQQGALAALFERQLAQAYPEQMTPYQQAQIELAQQEMAMRMQPEPVKPMEINGQLIDPTTGQVLGDYRTPDAPEAPASVREYEYYVQQAQARGEQPMPYEQFSVEKARAGASNVNVSTGAEVGTIPQGYELFTDPQTGARSMRPIPGGPEDQAAKQAAAAGQRATSANVITSAAQKARELISGTSTGVAGAVTAYNPQSNAAELYRQVEVMKSNATIEALTAMRAASPTGGALGSVTEKENAMLAAKIGALDPAAGPERFLAQLDDYERTLLQVIHGPEAGDAIWQATRKGGATPAAPKTAIEIGGYKIEAVD